MRHASRTRQNPSRSRCLVWSTILAAACCAGTAAGRDRLTFTEIRDNRGDYPGKDVPRFKKLEISFQVTNAVAENFQFPFDSDPPPGIRAGIGISVDADFTPDDWKTVYTQPAFYYQEFIDEVRRGQEWFYPTENYSWKVRFSPNQVGAWKYRLRARDASGSAESGEFSFQVSPSESHGFIRVSERDPRYFEFDNGAYFPALGYNMNFDRISWRNPILENEEHFRVMGRNGIQLIRIWLSQWSIFGSEWNPWSSQDPAQHSAYLPLTGITFEEAFPGSEVSMRIAADSNPCMFIGSWKARPAVRRDAGYRVLIRYKTTGMGAPVDDSKPFGFVAKTGNWLWSANESERCYSANTGRQVTPYRETNSGGWKILEGSIQTGKQDFLPNFFLVMENTAEGAAFVDYVAIQEDLGNGEFGPNIVSKPWMAHHLYFEQRNSYAFDKLLELAAVYGVYLRPVIHEKNERIFNRFNHEGQVDPENPSNNYFYGQWRNTTKVRWLLRAWWRYLQARWGYSPHIHSWELLNEGDPFNTRHYALADELGRYMHSFAPNDHLVSTSTWHSFPRRALWDHSDYPNIDFADVHSYVRRESDTELRIDNARFMIASPLDYGDAAAVTTNLSELIGAKAPFGAGKPVIRGETGFVTAGSGPPDPALVSDSQGTWLHNLVWAGINAGGLIESYWYETAHIYSRNRDGSYNFDHRSHFGSFYNFISSIALSNGFYEDAQAVASHPGIRVLGQKDPVHARAHLWIQNESHTWRNVVDGLPVPAVTAVVTVPGMSPGSLFHVVWWDTYGGYPQRIEALRSDRQGNLLLQVVNLTRDTAVKIAGYPTTPRRPVPWSGR